MNIIPRSNHPRTHRSQGQQTFRKKMAQTTSRDFSKRVKVILTRRFKKTSRISKPNSKMIFYSNESSKEILFF